MIKIEKINMRKGNIITALLIFIVGLFNESQAQEILSKQEVVKQVLENNFGVLIGDNNAEIAENNTSILNSGFLPTLDGNAGVNYNLNNLTANRQDGTSTVLKGATSSSYNASVNLNYTLFNGLGRWYNFKQLKEKYSLSKLEAQSTIENTVYQTLIAYYDVAVQTLNAEVFKQALEVSRNRLARADNNFVYGQGNKLAVLNAEVDLANDSISYANATLALDNAKRNLNNILVADLTTDFAVDTQVVFYQNMDKQTLYNEMMEKNVNLLQAQKNIEVGTFNGKIIRANYLPQISATTQYGWNKGINNEASFLASQTSYGLAAGLTLNWSLFDGGSTKVAMQNNKLNNENLALQFQNTENNLKRDFENAWANYQNSLYLYSTQLRNLKNNQDNFTRTNEQFKIGQVSSVEYRQAQQNLLNAAIQVTQSKFSAKVSELTILQLSGVLLDAY